MRSNRSAIHALALVALIGCGMPLPACADHGTRFELSGDRAERIAAVARLLPALSFAPRDAYLLEEQPGDDFLGPADRQTFIALRMASADLSAGTNTLSPLSAKPSFVAPTLSRNWWPDQRLFETLRFYDSTPVTGTPHGWVGISAEAGYIYIYTFTM